MENKSILESTLKDLKFKISAIDARISSIQKDIASIAQSKEEEIQKEIHSEQSKIKRNYDFKVQQLEKCGVDLLNEVDSLIEEMKDKSVSNNSTNCCKDVDISKILSKLYEIYPDRFIYNYVLYSPKVYKDSGTLLRDYNILSDKCDCLNYNINTVTLYKCITILLSNLDYKVVLGILGIIIISSVFIPWIPAIVLICSSVVGIVSGYSNNKLLHTSLSIKQCLEESFDTEVYEQDKSNLIDSAREYINSVVDEYKSDLMNLSEEIDKDSIITKVDDNFKKKHTRLTERLESEREEQKKVREEIIKLQDKLSKLDAHNKELADKASELYLSGVNLGDKFIDSVYLGNKEDNSLVMQTLHRTPTLFLSNDPSNLFLLAKLIIYQVMIRINPDIVSQTFIDHKYVGGDLQSLFRVASGRFPVAIKEDDINERLDFIDSDILARVYNILSSCNNLDEFNEIMKEYDSYGESHVLVHVFGLSKINSIYSNLLLNGMKVGYYFYLYLSMEDLKSLDYKDLLPRFSNIYVVDEFPKIASTNDIIKRLENS